jgi:mono/diheme cytochrome c family protein
MRAARIAALFVLGSSVLMWAASEPWINRVPAAQRERANPYGNSPDASAAGRVLFEEHCAQCHGKDAQGRRGPSLRSVLVERATDGELAWILKNGNVREGMPSWGRLPEPQRWQIISYLRSLPRDGSGEVAEH